MLLQDFNLAWLQLTYAIAFFPLPGTRAWNVISLDTLLLGSPNQGSGAKAATVR